jgi:formyltetrahydrofolate deformylase
MSLLSPAFIERHPQRIINFHHSFLPAFVCASHIATIWRI